jgi:hypothetical protein
MIWLLLILLLPSLASGGVIFSDNFDSFTSGWTPQAGAGHHVTGGDAGDPGYGEPGDWTGYINQDAGNYLAIVTGEGRNGTPCLKIAPNPSQTPWDQVGLAIWLGETGYEEIYIRYYVKYDNAWRWGDGTNGSVTYQKWLRIWQDVALAEILGQEGNMSSEAARGALVFTTTDDESADFSPFFNGTFLKNAVDDTLGSVGRMYYYPWDASATAGFIETHFGNIDGSGYWDDTQAWHCLEIHIKLADSWAGPNGEFHIYIDGVELKDPTYTIACTTMPTAKKGVGINYIGIHDNGTGNQLHGTYKYLYIDDFVVSDTYIGPVDATPPLLPPARLEVVGSPLATGTISGEGRLR